MLKYFRPSEKFQQIQQLRVCAARGARGVRRGAFSASRFDAAVWRRRVARRPVARRASGGVVVAGRRVGGVTDAAARARGERRKAYARRLMKRVGSLTSLASAK